MKLPFANLFSRPRRIASRSTGPTISAGFGNQGGTITTDSFEALRSSPDRTAISSTSLSNLRTGVASWWASSASTTRRESLASLARYIEDNYGLVQYALSLICNYSVPVNPKANSADPVWNQAADQYFEDWSSRCDFTGRFDRNTLQRLTCHAIDTDGDVGVTMDASRGWPQLRFWPTWRIGQKAGMTDRKMVEGVIIDDQDVVTGYQVAVAPGDFRVLDANQMLLLYEPNRFERYRGLSAMRSGMNDIRDVSDIKGFLKLGTKIESAIVAAIEGSKGVDENDWKDPDNASASVGSANPAGLTTGQLFGGEIPVIDGTLKQLQSNTPGTNKLEFLDTLAGFFVAGLGLPPAFFLDEKLTGPNQRGVIAKAQRKFETRKCTMSRLARWEWVRVIGDAIATGALPPVDNWQRCKIQSPPLLSIDIGDTAAAEASAVKEGRMSRQHFHGNAGRDWQDEEEQIFREDELVISKAKEQAERHGIPVETILSRHSFAQPKVAPQPAGGAA